MAHHLTLTPADGWVNAGLAASLRLVQVDPRITTITTPAIEITRGDTQPATDATGCILLGGDAVTEDTVDSIGVGANVYVRAIITRAQVFADPGYR